MGGKRVDRVNLKYINNIQPNHRNHNSAQMVHVSGAVLLLCTICLHLAESLFMLSFFFRIQAIWNYIWIWHRFICSLQHFLFNTSQDIVFRSLLRAMSTNSESTMEFRRISQQFYKDLFIFIWNESSNSVNCTFAGKYG